MSSQGTSGERGGQRRRLWSDLGPRLLSAAVLVPLTAVALWLGGYFFAAVVGLVIAGAYREWEMMVTIKPLTSFGIFLMAALWIAAVVFPPFGALGTLIVALVAAVIAVARGGESAWWRAGGLLYFGIVMVAMLAIRGSDWSGIVAGLFLALAIWLTDTGAFFTGRQVGGEKLAPDISPGKTWSGAIGGFVLGTACATIFWHFFTASPWWIGLILAGATSILGQIGDLSESALKRRFKIKDSGDIIPGHGGLMDRLDSITFGALFVCLAGTLHAGPTLVASGFLNW